jgi:hypothetical protein
VIAAVRQLVLMANDDLILGTPNRNGLVTGDRWTRCAPIMALPSTKRLTTEANAGLASTLPRGFLGGHARVAAKLVRSRHSTLCRTVPGRLSVPFSRQRWRVPSLNLLGRSQGASPDRIQMSKAVLFNDIDRWVMRCALVVGTPGFEYGAV